MTLAYPQEHDVHADAVNIPIDDLVTHAVYLAREVMCPRSRMESSMRWQATQILNGIGEETLGQKANRMIDEHTMLAAREGGSETKP